MLNRRQFLRTSLMTAAGALLAGVVGRFGVGEAKGATETVAPVVPTMPVGKMLPPKIAWNATNTEPIYVTNRPMTLDQFAAFSNDSIPETLAHPVDADYHETYAAPFDIHPDPKAKSWDDSEWLIHVKPQTPGEIVEMWDRQANTCTTYFSNYSKGGIFK